MTNALQQLRDRHDELSEEIRTLDERKAYLSATRDGVAYSLQVFEGAAESSESVPSPESTAPRPRRSNGDASQTRRTRRSKAWIHEQVLEIIHSAEGGHTLKDIAEKADLTLAGARRAVDAFVAAGEVVDKRNENGSLEYWPVIFALREQGNSESLGPYTFAPHNER